MRSITARPASRADIERLYADFDAAHIELSSELVEFHVQRGRFMRAQAASEMLRDAGRGLKRLFGGARSAVDTHTAAPHPTGPLKPSNV
mgnify:FL=1